MRRGDSRGRCPFCRHGAYSLLVDGRDDSYFCTDCLACGHALDFYARMERCNLPDVVTRLKPLLVCGQLKGKRPRMDRFRRIIDETHRFAREALVHSREGESALTWLDRQGVTPATVEAFALGLLSSAFGKQLLERLRTMGFSPDELEQAGIDGWMSCWEDRLKAGESNSTLLLPVRDRDGYCCGFYEQSLGPEAALTWSSHVFPYGYQLLSPHRFNRLVYSATNGQKVPSSVVLAERPWDVVLLASAGMEDAVYVEPLDSAEYREHLNSYLWRVTSAIWPIRQADVTVEFLRHLLKCSNQSIGRLRFMVLPPGTRLSELIRREGVEAVRGRLAEAKSLREWFGV
jgi:DNA primase